MFSTLKSYIKRGQMKYCSMKCRDITGSNNPRWKGGKKVIKGYVYILKPKHPQAIKAGYILKHRFIMEQYLGRYLNPKEIVHHENKNTLDNRLYNLR